MVKYLIILLISPQLYTFYLMVISFFSIASPILIATPIKKLSLKILLPAAVIYLLRFNKSLFIRLNLGIFRCLWKSCNCSSYIFAAFFIVCIKLFCFWVCISISDFSINDFFFFF